MESALVGVESATEVKPRALGLGTLAPMIDCIVRDDDDTLGAGASIIMRPGTPESEVRYALEDLGFDQRSLGWVRDTARRGEVEGVFFQTYGELSGNLSKNDPTWRFRDAFPAETVVLGASLRGTIAHEEQIKSKPSEPTQVFRVRWHCSYSPTYNNNWHDDVICVRGSESVRPVLRPWDSFVTETEIMQSAHEYERQLNSR